ncbi:unnamed protein product [Nezara viridula]|uniref:Dynamin-1-like protein n=1 Tax=Nezara viridula TaxID=85310 RepID=A0A9P0MLD9_NEZVI|nr:unnamed protein product [Nezara viridula]
MDRLISVLNKLQDVMAITGKDTLQLPQIVVVGDQSSGKSSVLEGLVGKPFLPRGVGVVTRRPLLIHLEYLPKKKGRGDEESGSDHVVFSHDSRVFKNFREVMKEIEEETDRAAGTNKGICSEPIVMTIYSRNAASNLTLIDLPGIIKVPMGDQPSDIEDVLKALILRYISNPNSIILAIVTANTDIATSESLKMAKEVDPEGVRTLAVVTKLDIMDTGTNATDILSGKVIPVKLGVVGVVNRSQRDIVQGISIKEAGIQEMNFFYKYYPQLANKHGTSYLARTLQELLIDHIKANLPQLRQRIQESMEQHKSVLQRLSGADISAPGECLLNLLTSFSNTYCAKIQGTGNELEMSELGGGARISYIFHETFASALNSINPLAGYNTSAILTAIKNASGTRPGLFMSESCFELLVKKQITRLESPSLRCVQLVYDELEKIIYSSCQSQNLAMARYPKLHQKILEVVIKMLKSRLPETNSLVKKLIEIQTAYINTAHPDFHINGQDHMGTDYQIVPFKEEDHPRESGVTIENLVIKYFNIVRKTIQDAVPKAIMHCLVNYSMNHILSELVSILYSPGKAEQFLEESADIAEQRAYALRMLEVLENANSIITEVKEGYCLV